MALKALDKTFENFAVGDIVVHSGYGDAYGVRIVQKVFLVTTGEYHFIGLDGEVKGGKWVDSKSGGHQVVLVICTAKDLRSYSHKWTPGETFNVGDILKDQDGTMYLYASADDVWNLTKGTRTTQAKWEASWGRVCRRQTTASGDPFTKVVKMENIWSSRW